MILVGATGELGGRVVRQLLGRGAAVHCLVRPRTADGNLTALGAQIARGDLTNVASLRLACAGVDTVVSTATAITRLLTGDGGPSIREVDGVGMAALVDIAQAAGATRFVYLSYAGVDAGLGFPLERAKLATELRLRASSMRVTIVRPAAYQEIHFGPVGRFDLVAGKVAVIGRGALTTSPRSSRSSRSSRRRRASSSSGDPKRSAATRRSPSPSEPSAAS
ncbi:SDR family oxidoreductase [Pengzhenrongella sp.]|uniref:SDR family oxidoreductase n=1 Tax=Pengzhenrongella sp. TaxID=2888820 RepID=UPI002F95A900